MKNILLIFMTIILAHSKISSFNNLRNQEMPYMIYHVVDGDVLNISANTPDSLKNYKPYTDKNKADSDFCPQNISTIRELPLAKNNLNLPDIGCSNYPEILEHMGFAMAMRDAEKYAFMPSMLYVLNCIPKCVVYADEDGEIIFEPGTCEGYNVPHYFYYGVPGLVSEECIPSDKDYTGVCPTKCLYESKTFDPLPATKDLAFFYESASVEDVKDFLVKYGPVTTTFMDTHGEFEKFLASRDEEDIHETNSAGDSELLVTVFGWGTDYWRARVVYESESEGIKVAIANIKIVNDSTTKFEDALGVVIATADSLKISAPLKMAMGLLTVLLTVTSMM